MKEQPFSPAAAEQFHPEEDRMSENEAHEEANLVREIMVDTSNATPQDYDDALQTLEELREAAEDESTYKKVAFKILRGATTGTLNVISSLTAVVGGYGSPDDIPDPRIFIDASRKLEILKARTEKRVDDENKKLRRRLT